MKPSELNQLVDGCLSHLSRSRGRSTPIEVNSVNTYADSIYLSFRAEQDAIDAANYFNGLKSSSEPLVSVYLETTAALRFKTSGCDRVSEEKSIGGEVDVETIRFDNGSGGYECLKKRQRVNIECEVLVSDRQLK